MGQVLLTSFLVIVAKKGPGASIGTGPRPQVHTGQRGQPVHVRSLAFDPRDDLAAHA